MAMRLPLSIAWGSWVHYVFSLSSWPPSLDRDIIGELWYSHTVKSSQGKRWGAEICTVAKMDLKSLPHLRSKRMLSPSIWIVQWANLNCHLGKQGIAGIEKSMQTKERGQAAWRWSAGLGCWKVLKSLCWPSVHHLFSVQHILCGALRMYPSTCHCRELDWLTQGPAVDRTSLQHLHMLAFPSDDLPTLSMIGVIRKTLTDLCSCWLCLRGSPDSSKGCFLDYRPSGRNPLKCHSLSLRATLLEKWCIPHPPNPSTPDPTFSSFLPVFLVYFIPCWLLPKAATVSYCIPKHAHLYRRDGWEGGVWPTGPSVG